MTVFRVRCTDGSECEMKAQRVSASENRTYFEARRDGAWVTLTAIDNETIEEVRRRVTELNGNVRWVRARPRPTADVVPPVVVR